MEIITHNANTLFSDMFWRFRTSGVPTETRNGPALRIDEPVLTTVLNPMERVLFHEKRDCNPVFHLLESIWMLAGRRDVKFLAQFNSKISQYSDDGRVFNAAYGHRMRSAFRVDQLVEAIELLRRDPKTRRCVVQLWNPEDLCNQTSKDLACNLLMVFSLDQDGALNCLVSNRSNDSWFGYAGANIVHFTVIQEFVARALGVPVGRYSTVTTNLHLYTELYSAGRYLDMPPRPEEYDFYRILGLTPRPLMNNSDYRGFLEDCEVFCEAPFSLTAKYKHEFFPAVARPMAMVSMVRRAHSADGHRWAEQIEARDWRAATLGWIERREKARQFASK